jgi:hypothetical protein
MPDTSQWPGRHHPAQVKREVLRRHGDICAVPYCGHAVWLDYAHVVPHAFGGSRERRNTGRLCRRHHRMFDEGRLRLFGTPDAPRFVNSLGHDMSRRAAGPWEDAPAAGPREDGRPGPACLPPVPLSPAEKAREADRRRPRGDPRTRPRPA